MLPYTTSSTIPSNLFIITRIFQSFLWPFVHELSDCVTIVYHDLPVLTFTQRQSEGVRQELGVVRMRRRNPHVGRLSSIDELRVRDVECLAVRPVIIPGSGSSAKNEGGTRSVCSALGLRTKELVLDLGSGAVKEGAR